MADTSRPPVWSPEARGDLAEIWSYYAQTASRRIADNIIREIGQAVDCLRIIPMAVARATKSGRGSGRSSRIRM